MESSFFVSRFADFGVHDFEDLSKASTTTFRRNRGLATCRVHAPSYTFTRQCLESLLRALHSRFASMCPAELMIVQTMPPAKEGLPSIEFWPVHLNSSSSTILATLASCAEALLGTRVATNAPLMSSGMDSLAITAFTNAVSDQLSIETLATTMVFDHPSLDCIAAHMSELEAPRIAEPAADFVGRGSTEVAAALKAALEGACVGLMSTMGAPQKL